MINIKKKSKNSQFLKFFFSLYFKVMSISYNYYIIIYYYIITIRNYCYSYVVAINNFIQSEY